MNPVSVTQVNEYIAKKLRDDFNLRGIVVEGEVSAFSVSGRNAYLTLKDQNSQLKCSIWSNHLEAMDRSVFENGRKIIVVGDISPYAKGGYYSLSIKHAEAAGIGDAMAEFNRVKALLEAEGLFDKAHKRQLPPFPSCVGVITSATGAAVEDIKKIITQKNNFTDILIFPTFVQGQLAPDSIKRNIAAANELNRSGKRIDVLIVGRGGGSPEDLAAFNDEGVARAIYASEIPVISAVGHESDFSISDFVADARAETPTAAADMAVTDTGELRETIIASKRMLLDSISYKLEFERHFLANLTDMIYAKAVSKVNEYRLTVEKALIALRENNPDNVFGKGYAAVTDETGSCISDIASIGIGERYRIRLRNGSFEAEAVSVNREE